VKAKWPGAFASKKAHTFPLLSANARPKAGFCAPLSAFEGRAKIGRDLYLDKTRLALSSKRSLRGLKINE